MPSLSPGDEFAGYRVVEEIGRGGMGIVYRAVEVDLGRQVALKLVTPDLAGDEDFRRRFQQEARTAASIDHPNVIPIYDAGEEDGQLYLAMRFVEGTDLDTLISREGPLEAARAAAIVDQIGAALDAAHARGLVHRDIKPGNALVAGEREHVYLSDFGLTKAAGGASGLTGTGMWVGTLDYVAPEQVRDEDIDARADVYALGGVLFQALTGSIPFDRKSDPAKLFAHLNDAPPRPSDSRPGLPAEIDGVVARAMAKDPAERFPSAGDLGRAAVAAAHGQRSAEPERTVAAGEAAPAAMTVAASPVTEPTAAQAGVGATVAAAGAGAAPTAAAPSGEGKRGLSSRAVILLAGAGVAAVLVAGLAVAGVFGGGEGSDSKGGRSANSPPAGSAEPIGAGAPIPSPADDSTPAPAPQPEPVAAVTPADVRSLLSAYEAAYTNESVSGLSRLFGPGFRRRNGTDPPQNKARALAEYAKQFALLDAPFYDLRGLQVRGGARSGTAAGSYLIGDAGRKAGSGTIQFHVRSYGAGGRNVRIDAIAIQPD